MNKYLKSSLIAIGLGFVLAFILMLVLRPSQAFSGMYYLTLGSFFSRNWTTYIGGAITKSAPIILTGVSVGFAFRTGLFNIGAAGQALVGGFTAIAIGILVPLPAPWHWIVAVIGAIAAGALWGLINGYLKAQFNVNEVVTAIMMNYIGAIIVKWLIKMPGIYESSYTRTYRVLGTANTPTLGLDLLFDGSNLDIGIFIAVAVATLIWFLLNKTTLGYELKAVGFNKDAAQYAGIKYKRNVVISMAIAGAISGLAGALIYLSASNVNMRPYVLLLPEGYDGISVALLAHSNPFGAILSGLFISYLRQGSQLLQFTAYDPEIAELIIAVIIYFSALSGILIIYFDKWVAKMKQIKTKLFPPKTVASSKGGK